MEDDSEAERNNTYEIRAKGLRWYLLAYGSRRAGQIEVRRVKQRTNSRILVSKWYVRRVIARGH